MCLTAHIYVYIIYEYVHLRPTGNTCSAWLLSGCGHMDLQQSTLYRAPDLATLNAAGTPAAALVVGLWEQCWLSHYTEIQIGPT